MSILKKPLPVKLFFSIFSNKIDVMEEVIKELNNQYGLIDIKSSLMNFDQTNYYENEFGKNLKRLLIFFENLIAPEEIVDVKIKALNLENFYSENNKRLVNIDPGYLTLSRVILTTGKDYTHRIYLCKGVYADLTYIFKKGEGYISLPWTYPDYASNEMKRYFLEARKVYKEQLKGLKND